MSEHFQNQIKNRRKIPLADIYDLSLTRLGTGTSIIREIKWRD